MFADTATAAEAIAADRWQAGGRRQHARMAGFGARGSRAVAQGFGRKMVDMQQAGYHDPWTSQHMHTQAYAPCGMQWYQPMPVVMTGVVPAMQMPEAHTPPPDIQNAPSAKAVLPAGPVNAGWSVDPVSVDVVGLPTALCTNGIMEAMLEQAGLEHSVLGYEVNPQGRRGQATIRLATYEAAAACVAHFHGHRCAHDRHAVTAHIAESNHQMRLPPSGDIWERGHSDSYRREGSTDDCGDDIEEDKSDKTEDSGSVRSKRSTSSFPSELRLPSLTASPTNSNSNKPRWADLDDEDEEDSTSAGTPSAADEIGDSPWSSAASSGSSFGIGGH